jgi:DNA-binding response OmpR family regulator
MKAYGTSIYAMKPQAAAQADAALAGRRILVVEDESLVAMLLETALEDQQCVIVGPFARVPAALDAARQEQVDMALLDVNLAGEKVYPVAEALSARGVPFLLLSGYGEQALPPDKPDWPVFQKPFKIAELISRIESVLHAG